ncbi:unnamed protein product, partial [Musa banksii]
EKPSDRVSVRDVALPHILCLLSLLTFLLAEEESGHC